VKIWLPWAQHTSSILHTITLQTIVYMTPAATESQSIRWEDISASAKETLFRVWEDRRELLWAEHCWGLLSKYGLTRYSHAVAKCRVLIRLIALAELYREFSDLAWEETYEPELVAWGMEIELNSFRVAQCMGHEFQPSSDEDEEELFESALCSLAEEARREVYLVLKAEFGGDGYLFASLWNTVEYVTEDEEAEIGHEEGHLGMAEGANSTGEIGLKQHQKAGGKIDWLENAPAILSDVTPGKMSAYEWIERGMPRVR
jgi:hypothetical protein